MCELELYESLLNSINNDDITEILKTVSEYYQAPIMIVDGNYNLVTYYSDEKVEDELWESIIRDSYVPFEYVILFNERNMIEEHNFSKEPKYYTMGPKIKYDRIIASLYLSDELLGYLAVLTFNYNENIHKTTKLVSKFLSDYLFHHKMIERNQNTEYRLFLTYLFDDKIETEQQFNEYCNFVKIDRRGNYILLSCKVPAYYSRKQLIRSLQREYRPAHAIRSFYHNRNLYILAEEQQLPYCMKMFEEMTANKFAEELYWGYSDHIHDLFELEQYKKQADLAAEYASQMKENVAFYSIVTTAIADCIKNNMAENLYRTPLLLELKKYDSANNSQYYDTLKNYVNMDCQLKQTGHAMNIHRNTLVYRLKVIEDKFHVDLTSLDLILQLYLNFKIEDL